MGAQQLSEDQMENRNLDDLKMGGWGEIKLEKLDVVNQLQESVNNHEKWKVVCRWRLKFQQNCDIVEKKHLK